MKKVLAAVALATLMSSPAMAGQCPVLMAELDAAMATATVDEATKTQLMALYEEGKAAHEAGDHAASEAKLNEAKAILGL